MSAIQNIDVNTIEGKPTNLGNYDGKVLLVVNVASKCGLTPQYEGLEKLYRDYADQGLVICGFPANDFGAQEPGSDAEIAIFCSTSYHVSFPMFSKITVSGPEKHPLYGELIDAAPEKQGDAAGMREMLKGHGISPNDDPEVLWNFEKFLIGRDGEVKARFAPSTPPDDATLIAAIEKELAA